MVTSSTYKQSSSPNQKYVEIDPNNIYLWRSNSYRLSAEMIRDNALAASGLLIKKIGGESVRPYQPDGLWREKSNFSIKLLDYKISDTDEDLYRRSLYTFLRRTSPPPSMSVFDAPSREVCTVKREITNTPLQALVLLNDPQFFEASRVLAERIQIEKPESIEKSIEYGFQLCTSRIPSNDELQILKEFYNITNVPVLINTSFNIGGEAIVNSADDAINSFLQMDIDYLLLGDNIYEKSSDFDKRYNKLSLDIFIKKRQVLFNKVNKFPKYNITNYNYNFFTNFSVQLKQFIKQKIYQDYI